LAFDGDRTPPGGNARRSTVRRGKSSAAYSTSPSRGEGGAPSLGPASASPFTSTTAGPSDRGAPGGGGAAACSNDTPTRNAIGLSPLGEFAARYGVGGPSPWRSNLPPPGGGVVCGGCGG
jgi:hypothetical protein